jgi:cyanophycinase
MPGPVALIGGNEFREPCRELDEWLLERSAQRRRVTVTVLPTAAAHSHPEAAVATARKYFADLGAAVHEVMVLDRADADDHGAAEDLERAKFIYIPGGDPRHLAESLRDSLVWTAILKALASGAVLAGSSAGAMVLCDRMAGPRSQGLADGLGLLKDLIVLPHHNTWKNVDQQTANAVGLDECTGLILDGNVTRVLGAGTVTWYRDGKPVRTVAAPAAL